MKAFVQGKEPIDLGNKYILIKGEAEDEHISLQDVKAEAIGCYLTCAYTVVKTGDRSTIIEDSGHNVIMNKSEK